VYLILAPRVFFFLTSVRDKFCCSIEHTCFRFLRYKNVYQMGAFLLVLYIAYDFFIGDREESP
jgi:hypothetical protein